MPWEFWAVVVAAAILGVALVLIVLIRGWVEVRRAQPTVPVVVPTPVATPAAPAPAAPAAPAEEDEDPERIFARATAEDARSAVRRLARAATKVSLERRLLDAAETEREAFRARARREAVEEEIYPPLPQRADRRERVRVATGEAPAAPQPRQPQPAAQNAGQARRQGRWADAATNAAAAEQDVRDKGYGDAFYGRPEVLPLGLNAQQQGWYRAAYQEGLVARRGATNGQPQPAAPAAPQPAAAAPVAPQPNVAALLGQP